MRPDLVALVDDMRGISIRALRRMYSEKDGMYIHCLRKHPDGILPEGISIRYTAIALIAFAQEPDIAAEALPNDKPQNLCGRMIDRAQQSKDLGEVALTLWSARVLGHPRASQALRQLQAMRPATTVWPTVEMSWALTALCLAGRDDTDIELRDALAKRLLASQNARSGLFPHWPEGAAPSAMRAHVTCYADMVYPIQALSQYYLAAREPAALEAAKKCAERMCALQGAQGQWWWHHDLRVGKVVERFPVYAIHQDAMGPMTLFALWKAGGPLHRRAVEKSLEWLIRAPEIPNSLVDRESDIIWRKVARHEPGKLSRGIQAVASRIHPALRVPALDLIFRPGWIDYESRPYHMGWLLYAFPAGRVAELGWC